MSPLQAAILGAVQGLTEFLPVSSSAHLYVIPTLMRWPYGGVAFDVALHWGTLIALLVAFWRDWWNLLRHAISSDATVRREAHVTWLKLAAASVPAAVAGLLVRDLADTMLRWLPLQATMLVVFGFLLWWVDRSRPTGSEDRFPGWGACMFIGAMQALALVPGVSRSGVTITAGRAAGMARVASARFAFLLGTPITFGAGLVKLGDISPDMPLGTLAVGVVTAAVFGLLAIHGLMRWLARAGFAAFFAYRAALALLILLVPALS